MGGNFVYSDSCKLSEAEGMDPFKYLEEIRSSLKALNNIAKRPSVDVEFEKLTYTAKNLNGKGKYFYFNLIAIQCRKLANINIYFRNINCFFFLI